MTASLRPFAELESFLESLPEPHILFNRQYRIVAANRAYRQMFGDARSVIGRTCYEVSHHYPAPCDQAGESCPLARSLVSQQREKVLHLHYTPRGEEYLNIELSPLRNRAGEIELFAEKMEPLPVGRGRDQSHDLIGKAPRFRQMLGLVSRVAPSEATVLLQGESGTGKELMANMIHQASKRAEKPFIAVDCSGVPETLFESELFGHERGAFTGATNRKIGLIEAASGGTLFLDEVGDIRLGMQVKLLRLLETGTYRRVGSTELRQADIRVISATHRTLRELVDEGSFRQDLYYRLNTFPIVIPPLRERASDIPLLAVALLERVATGRRLRLSLEAAACLRAYAFPGNVRELRNILERASLMCDGETIGVEHLAGEVRAEVRTEVVTGAPRSSSTTSNGHLAHFERQALEQALAAHHGSRKALAKRLGVSERTLYRKLKRHQIGSCD